MSDEREILIVHSEHEKDYFVYSRLTAQDRTISYEALGILTYLLSRPQNWQANVNELAKYATKYRVYKALRELRKSGYVTLKKQKGEGKFSSWGYTVYDTSQLGDRQQVDGQLVDSQRTNKVQKKKQSTEKKNTPLPPKGDGFPKRFSNWKDEHYLRYGSENCDSLTELMRLDGFPMPHYESINIPEKKRLIAVVRELKDCGVEWTEYSDLLAHIRREWKAAPITVMPQHVTKWRTAKETPTEPPPKPKIDLRKYGMRVFVNADGTETPVGGSE